MHPSKEAQQVSQSNLRATSKSSPRRDRERADAPPKALLPPGSFTQPPFENFEGHAVRLSYDVESKSFAVEAPPEVEVIEAYWFAWLAFHPATTVYEAGR